MAKISGSNKKTRGSILSKAGRPAKAGRRRPPHLKSTIDHYGKRQWEATNT